MESNKKRAREIQAAIERILWEDWDPIEVNNQPEAKGEYDAYAGGVYRLLASGASVEELTAHLQNIEKVEMGSSGKSERAHNAARKLCAMNIAGVGNLTGR